MSYAVVAIDVDIDTEEAPLLFAGTAEKFQPHITLIPRTKISKRWSQETLGRTFRQLARGLIPPIELVGPMRMSEILLWYECTPSCGGFRDLLGLHQEALRLLPFDLVAFKEFTGRNFRPHLTLFWNGSVTRVAFPPSLKAKPIALSLYRYKDDPKFSSVVRHQIALLNRESG